MPSREELLARIKERTDISKEVQALVNATKDLPRATIITHEKIEEIVGHKRQGPHNKYQQIITKWKKDIQRDHGVKWVSSHGVGYRSLTVEAQLKEYTRKQYRRANKCIQDAAVAVATIKPEELDENQTLLANAQLSFCADQQKIHKLHDANQTSWFANPETLPRFRADTKKVL